MLYLEGGRELGKNDAPLALELGGSDGDQHLGVGRDKRSSHCPFILGLGKEVKPCRWPEWPRET